MNVLLDSGILIDHFNGIGAATAYLRDVHGRSMISVIIRAEVLTGFDREQRAPVLRLLERFPILGIDREVADLAAGLRRDNRWRIPDAFQAALAERHQLKLATRNSRDFPPV